MKCYTVVECTRTILRSLSFTSVFPFSATFTFKRAVLLHYLTAAVVLQSKIGYVSRTVTSNDPTVYKVVKNELHLHQLTSYSCLYMNESVIIFQ